MPQVVLSRYASSLPRLSVAYGLSGGPGADGLQQIAAANDVHRSLIGLGYYGCIPGADPASRLREPGLVHGLPPIGDRPGAAGGAAQFQTLISELTGLPIANASLLDEATAAEAMALSLKTCRNRNARRFLVDEAVFPQTWAVLETQAEPLGLSWSGSPQELVDVLKPPTMPSVCCCSCPATLAPSAPRRCHCGGTRRRRDRDGCRPHGQVLMAPVAELGVEIAVGSTRRLGIPGLADYAALLPAQHQRKIPGRLVGQSVDTEGHPACAGLQTREQHIRQDKAAGNICTAQVLLAVMANFYTVHHGPDGCRRSLAACCCCGSCCVAGWTPGAPAELAPGPDTLRVRCANGRN